MSAHRRFRRTMSRRAVAVVAASVLVFVGAACGGDDDEDAAVTTTIATNEDTPPEQTTTTLSDEEYTAVADEFNAQLAAAGTDLCDVIRVPVEVSPPPAANSAQMEQVVGLYAGVLRAYGASTPDNPELAEGFNRIADELIAEAEAAGYPLDVLDDPQALQTDEALALQQQFEEIAVPACEAEFAPEIDDSGQIDDGGATEPATGEG